MEQVRILVLRDPGKQFFRYGGGRPADAWLNTLYK